jgi:glycosyltransferase involved in cell wall biosynthesis
MKKKVLHIINSLTIGGAETLLVNSLSQGGLSEHTENYLLYFNQSSNLLNLIDKDVKIICLNYKGGFDIWRILRKIKRVISENNIDIVHSHLTPAGVYTNLVCPGGVKHLHTIHSTYSMENETRWFMRFIDRYLFLERKNCNIITLSDYTKTDLLKSLHFKGKLFVLNNFVADRYFNLPQKQYNNFANKLHLVAVGALKNLKNFEYLLEVFSYLTDKEIYLDIYGDGNKEHYEEVIKNKNLKIKMMGQVDDMATVIQQYDLFIMPSKFEGFPLSVFEAMAAGLPLMLSDIDPLTSIVKENAIYFQLDNARGTAEQIIGVQQNKIDIRDMAVKAKAYAEQKARRDIYIKKLLDIYNQLSPSA